MTQPQFETRIAQNKEDMTAAYALRYQVFIKELGGDGPLVDHDRGLESDAIDAHCQHLLLLDTARAPEDQVVGVYRLLDQQGAAKAGGYYSESEFDISALTKREGALLEIGRSCIHVDYRSGPAMHLLWSALGDYVLRNNISTLFGVASFHSTDLEGLRAPLSWLFQRFCAPDDLQATSRQHHDLLAHSNISRRDAMAQVPALIKGYLKLGGYLGTGVFIDQAFGSTDVFMVLETKSVDFSVQRRIADRARQ